MHKDISTRRLTLLLPMLLAVTGCAGSAVISATTSACSQLLPEEWKEGVGHAPPPTKVTVPNGPTLAEQLAFALAALKSWEVFATAEAGQVEKADGRYRDGVGIIERCEARDRDAVKRSRPKVLGIF